MNNFNFVVLEGFLTEDPKYSIGSTPIDATVMFTIKSKNNEAQEIEFNIYAKGNLSYTCKKYLRIDTRVLVSGNLIKGDMGEDAVLAKEINFLTGK